MRAAVAYAGVALSLAGAYLGAVVVAVGLVPVATGASVPVAVALLSVGLVTLHPRALGPVLRQAALGTATWCVARAFESAPPPARRPGPR